MATKKQMHIQYLSDKFKVMREKGSVWVTHNNKRMRLVPWFDYDKPQTCFGAFVKDRKKKIAFTQLIDKDGLRNDKRHVRWKDVLAVAVEMHEKT